jgi:hypothetical protein
MIPGFDPSILQWNVSASLYKKVIVPSMPDYYGHSTSSASHQTMINPLANQVLPIQEKTPHVT